MRIEETGIAGCLLIQPDVHSDARGSFVELLHQQKLAAAGISEPFVQDNFSRSCRHALRGLHYQIRQPQGKLIWVPSGEIMDVVVDLRSGSPTLGKSLSFRLSEHSFLQLYVPPGLAHGFCVISERADVLYKCTDFYAPEHERTLLWNDPQLQIKWPVTEPILSDKDRQGTPFAQAELF